MREITPNLTKELQKFVKNNSIASSEAYPIKSFNELVEQTAKLSFLNKDYLLFYRGQPEDYRNKAGNTTLYPSIYRGDYLNQKELIYRFNYLTAAGKVLAKHFEENGLEGYKDVRRKNLIQWSILQHYEVCKTPLLDLTHSLRVAATFSLYENNSRFAYIYVLGLPYITNRISINSEHDLVNVRLLSICPPEALRPHYQEGYVAGTTDITNEYDIKTELDFNNRLIAKFKITTNINFWGDDFDRLPHNAIYPKDDSVKKICDKVKDEVNEIIMPGDVGEFLNKWSEVEQFLLEKTEKDRKTNSFIEALKIANKKNILDENTLMQIDKLRRFRNELVHQPKRTSPKSINMFMDILNNIVQIVLSTI